MTITTRRDTGESVLSPKYGFFRFFFIYLLMDRAKTMTRSITTLYLRIFLIIFLGSVLVESPLGLFQFINASWYSHGNCPSPLLTDLHSIPWVYVRLIMAKDGLRHVRCFKFLFLLIRELNINSTYLKILILQELERRFEIRHTKEII